MFLRVIAHFMGLHNGAMTTASVRCAWCSDIMSSYDLGYRNGKHDAPHNNPLYSDPIVSPDDLWKRGKR